MRLPTLAGTIERRLLINYRADPDVVATHLPTGFSPHVVDGQAVVGICLIQLRSRLRGFPSRFSVRSINGAHRYATIDRNQNPTVYIPRRDTNSALVSLAGKTMFPDQHRAEIHASENDAALTMTLDSRDNDEHVSVIARPAENLPDGSVFATVNAASTFFENAQTGYSATGQPNQLDVVTLNTENWSVTPVAVDHVKSSYFDNPDRFPPGSIEFDHGLLMRNIDHTWRFSPQLRLA